MTFSIEVGKPDWRPLENAMPPDYCEDFMFMGKADDIVLYKHRITRRYLNIDAVTGGFYHYANGGYVEIDRRQADGNNQPGHSAVACHAAMPDLKNLKGVMCDLVQVVQEAVAQPAANHHAQRSIKDESGDFGLWNRKFPSASPACKNPSGE